MPLSFDVGEHIHRNPLYLIPCHTSHEPRFWHETSVCFAADVLPVDICSVHGAGNLPAPQPREPQQHSCRPTPLLQQQCRPATKFSQQRFCVLFFFMLVRSIKSTCATSDQHRTPTKITVACEFLSLCILGPSFFVIDSLFFVSVGGYNLTCIC